MFLDPLHQFLVRRLSVHIDEHHVHRVVPVAQGIDLHTPHAGDLQGPGQVVVLVPAGGRRLKAQDKPRIISLVRLGVIAAGECVQVGHADDAGDLDRHQGHASGRQIAQRPRLNAAHQNLPAAADGHSLHGGKLDSTAGLKKISLPNGPVAGDRQEAGGIGGRIADQAGAGFDVAVQLRSGQVHRVQLPSGLFQLPGESVQGNGRCGQNVIGGKTHRFLIALRHGLQHGRQCLRHPCSPPASHLYIVPL